MGLLLGLMWSVLLAPASGQTTRLADRNAIGWYVFNGDIRLSPRWGLHMEYQWRRTDFFRNWQQSLARVGVVYGTDTLQFAAGYTLLTTFPYGRYPVAEEGVPYPEHRLYEDIQWQTAWNRLTLEHRFRLEQRWLAERARDRSIEAWTFQNRIRYQFSLQLPLQKTGPTGRGAYLTAFDEVFISFGKKVGLNVFNQNRIMVGVGYRFQSAYRLELGYLNQILQHPEPEPITQRSVYEFNHGFRLGLTAKLRAFR